MNLKEVLTHIGGTDSGVSRLARLCNIRGLAAGSRDDMVRRLTRSYHGSLEDLMNGLRKEDLLAFLASDLEYEGRPIYVHAASQKNTDDLRRIALDFLVDADASGFVEREPISSVDRLREKLETYTGNRTVTISKLLEHAGIGPLERLRTERFQELVGIVNDAGFDVFSEDEGPNGSPYGEDDDSPGIDARVWVKAIDHAGSLKADDTQDESEPIEDDSVAEESDVSEDESSSLTVSSLPLGQPVRMTELLEAANLDVPTRLRTSRFNELVKIFDEAGYSLVDSDGYIIESGASSPGMAAQLVVIRKSGRSDAKPVADSRPAIAEDSALPSAYEIALARLQFLTGVPLAARPAQPDWPAVYLSLATDGLAIDTMAERVLRLQLSRCVDGTHAIDGALSTLKHAESRNSLTTLVDAFEILNEGAGQVLQELAGQIRTVLFGGGQLPLQKTKAPPPPSKPKIPEPSSPPSNSIVEAVIELSWAVALADGRIDPKEETKIMEEARVRTKAMGTTQREATLRILDKLDGRPIDLHQKVHVLKRGLSETERDHVMLHLIDVANADGILDPRELSLLEQIRVTLGVSPSVLEKTRNSPQDPPLKQKEASAGSAHGTSDINEILDLLTLR